MKKIYFVWLYKQHRWEFRILLKVVIHSEWRSLMCQEQENIREFCVQMCFGSPYSKNNNV